MLFDIYEPGQTPLPHADETPAVGIDLGTTHSVVAIVRDGKPEILRDMAGNPLHPSVVSYVNDAAVVGHAALELAVAGKGNTISSIKRHMGRDTNAISVSADILRHLKTVAEYALSHEITKAVITVPAYFDDAARTATKDAAELAGLHVLRLVAEPTAAALAYGLDSGAEGIYAVYDLGGGTFDISILRLRMGVFQVMAVGGDAQLGGDDMDELLAKHLGNADTYAARAIKEHLSQHDVWEQGAQTVTREQFEGLIQPLITRTIGACRRAIADAEIALSEIKGVVLVGGSTRVPLVRREVERFFGKTPVEGINPDEVVAAGAALQAEGLTRGSSNLLLDVTPLSLGLETMGGIVEKIIHRNTPIPVSIAQTFTTYQDNQTGLVVHVLQGEREMVDQCRSLAKFELGGIPPLPAGLARITVHFTVDADGLLTVSAKEEYTGVQQTVTVKPTYGLQDGDMENMLRASMENARADMEARLLAEARVEGQRVLLAYESAVARYPHLAENGELTTMTTASERLKETLGENAREAILSATEMLEKATQPFAARIVNHEVGAALTGATVDEADAVLKKNGTTD